MIRLLLIAPLLLGDPVVASSDVDRQSKRARSAYKGGRFTAAASLFDDLWRAHRSPDHLFNAGFAYEAAGKDLRAIARFARFAHLEGIAESDRLDARVRIGRLQAGLSPTILAITPGGVDACALVEVRDLEGETTVFALAWLPQLDDNASSAPPLDDPSALDEQRSCLDPKGEEGSASPRALTAERTLHLPPGRWVVQIVLPNAESSLFAAIPAQDVVIGSTSTRATGQAPEERQPRIAFDLERHSSSVHLVHIGPERSFFRPVDLTFEDRLGSHPTLVRSTQEPALDIDLPSGPWRFTIATRGRKRSAVTEEVELLPRGDLTVDVAALRSQPQRRRRLGGLDDAAPASQALTLSLGGTGLTLASAGATLVGLSAHELKTEREAGLGFPEDEDIGDDVTVLSAGAGVLGAGLGCGAAALSSSLGIKTRGWLIELGVGGALLTAGALGHGLARARFDDERAPVDGYVPESAVDDHAAGLATSALFLGAGVGLVLGAGASLLEHHLRRTRHTSRRAEFTGLTMRF